MRKLILNKLGTDFMTFRVQTTSTKNDKQSLPCSQRPGAFVFYGQAINKCERFNRQGTKAR